jgi:hypothetical protein
LPGRVHTRQFGEKWPQGNPFSLGDGVRRLPSLLCLSEPGLREGYLPTQPLRFPRSKEESLHLCTAEALCE